MKSRRFWGDVMKFYQITDMHFYPAREMKACGREWEQRAAYDQKCLAQSEAIVDAAIDFFLADKETDIILISGDNVSDGERVGHYALQKNFAVSQPPAKEFFSLPLPMTCILSQRAILRRGANM